MLVLVRGKSWLMTGEQRDARIQELANSSHTQGELEDQAQSGKGNRSDIPE